MTQPTRCPLRRLALSWDTVPREGHGGMGMESQAALDNSDTRRALEAENAELKDTVRALREQLREHTDEAEVSSAQ